MDSFENEILLLDKTELPSTFYHMVPEFLFNKFVSSNGDYDCRFQNEWGECSPYIHTTTDIFFLKERVSGRWEVYPKDIFFILLRIDTSKLERSSKITFTDCNDVRYFHIWAKLPRKSFSVFVIRRKPDGSFDF